MEKKAKRYINKRKLNDHVYGYAFTAPLMIGLCLFFFIPLVYAIYLSFTDYSFAKMDSYQFVGFQNYVNAFQDTWFLRSLLNACINAIGVPIGLAIALILSNLLVRNKRFSVLFRTIYYIPTICGAVAITFIWRWLYTPIYGFLPKLFEFFGVKNMVFLNENYFFPSMIVMGVWNGLGTSILLLFAALKNISKNLYEAAEIDGCNGFQKFMHVTVPGVSPITFYILITGIMGAFQDFARFDVMTGGSLQEWSVMPVSYIYKYTSSLWNYELGYASALGILLGLVILGLSAINFLVSRLWVKYE